MDSGDPSAMPLHQPSPRGSVLRVLVWFVSVVLILGVAAAIVADRFLRAKYEPPIGVFRKDVTEHVGFFCEQQTLLAGDPWFHLPRPQGDAGALLNAWIPWEPQTEPPMDSPLRLPAHLPRSNANFKNWLTSNVDVSSLDFGWMHKLHAYDRWDISRNTPTPLPERILMAEAPLPYLVSLPLWAKFRLLHGLRSEQPLEAAQDVRQLAWLAYRTDLLLGGAIAAALLQYEREAYDSLPSPPPEWRPMSQVQIDRMRAVLMSSMAFSNIAAPASVARQARSCGAPAVSHCAALAEAALMLKLVQPLVGDSYRETYSAFAEDVAAPTCPTALARTLWERGASLEEQRTAGTLDPDSAWLNSLPGSYAGSHIAGILISVGLPSLQPLQDLRSRVHAGPAQPTPP